MTTKSTTLEEEIKANESKLSRFYHTHIHIAHIGFVLCDAVGDVPLFYRTYKWSKIGQKRKKRDRERERGEL